jgi:hypothetical protein
MLGIGLSLTGGSSSALFNAPSLDLDFTTGTMPAAVTFTRASTAWAHNSSGVLTSFATNAPRFAYNPTTLAARGLLIEEARTNLFGNSTNLAYSFWSLANIFARTPYAGLAPDGSWTATLLEDNSTSVAQYVDATPAIPGTDTNWYTWSCYVKAGTSDLCHLRVYMTGGSSSLGSGVGVNFTFSTKTLGTPSGTGGQGAASVSDAGYVELPNGWFRVWVRIQNNNTGNVTLTCRLFPQNTSTAAVGTIYAWGAQAELGSYPTSMIVTAPTWTARASTATYYNSSGVLTTAASGVARLGYRYNGTTWVSAGTILESAGTNLVAGQMNSTTYWSLLNTTQSATTSPTGANDAVLLTETAGGVASYGTNPPLAASVAIVAGTQLTASIFAKAGTGNWIRIFLTDNNTPTVAVVTWFNLSTGAVGGTTTTSTGGTPTSLSASIQNVGGGWYRCSVSAILASVTTANMLVRMISADLTTTDTGSKTMSFYGPQLEANSSMTSYIPTTTASASRVADSSSQAAGTRAADNASIATLGSWFNAAEGTFVAEVEVPYQTLFLATGVMFGLSDGTIGNSLYLAAALSSDAWNVLNTSVNQTGSSSFASPPLTPKKFAGAYKLNDLPSVRNGGAVTADSSGTPPTGLIQGGIGKAAWSNSSYLNGYVRRIRVYPQRLINATLQALTT